jgi:hypothetical protein
LRTVGYKFGWMQITQVSKIASLIHLNVSDGMNHVMEKIIEEATTTTDPDIIGVSSMLAAKDKENSEGMCNIDHEAASPYTIHTLVLPKSPLIDVKINSAITAMLDIVQQKN